MNAILLKIVFFVVFADKILSKWVKGRNDWFPIILFQYSHF